MSDTDSALLRSVLQSMSNQIAGRSTTVMPGDEFLPEIEPEAEMPVEPVDEQPADKIPQVPTKSSSSYAWGGYQNGRIPADALESIGGGHKLESAAAQAWRAMVAAAAQDGIKLGLTDSYRDYDGQVSVRQRKGNKVATAKPGTSVHGWARAVDANVNNPKTRAWLAQNGPRFGWVNPAWAKQPGKNHEPWHYEYVGGNG